jgi:hypothetical protein
MKKEEEEENLFVLDTQAHRGYLLLDSLVSD